MNNYLYWPVAGAAVFWREACSLSKARASLSKLRSQWPEVEIERVLMLNGGARRYWRWRNGKWSISNHYDPKPTDISRWKADA